MGIGRNDTVSTLLPNVPAMIEAHYFVPMAGAVLNTLNIRLDAEALAFQLNHAQTRLLLVDPEFAGLAREVLKQVDHEVPMPSTPAGPSRWARWTTKTGWRRVILTFNGRCPGMNGRPSA